MSVEKNVMILTILPPSKSRCKERINDVVKKNIWPVGKGQYRRLTDLVINKVNGTDSFRKISIKTKKKNATRSKGSGLLHVVESGQRCVACS